MQTKHQAAANPQTKPTNLGCESAYRLPSSTPTVAIYYSGFIAKWKDRIQGLFKDFSRT